MKVWQQYNKRTKKNEWRARFKLNKKNFRPKAETKKELDLIIAEIRRQENREQVNEKHNTQFDIISYVPSVEEVFDKILPTVKKHHQKTLSKRVFKTFLSILKPSFKVNLLRQTHFQKYIDLRQGEVSKKAKKPVKLQTIYKELYAITSAFNKSKLYYESLEKWQVPQLPALPKGFKKKNRRQRLVTEKELSNVISELMKKPQGKQTYQHHFHRVRLAHRLEFGYLTGLRRKELANLKFSQYDESKKALLNVKRFKTDTITQMIPLGERGVKIVEERRKVQDDSIYIFTPEGSPIESEYRTLKNVCEKLNITYGRNIDGGFVPHDLRHNFATEILRSSDIETARELLGHADISQTGTYTHTSEQQLRDAIRKRDKIDYNKKLEEIFNSIKKKEIDLEEFKQKMRDLFTF
jgi:integrase